MASAAFEEIVEDFEFLEDWEDRYRHVIDMGKAMEDLEAAFKVDANKVHGCASQVWLQFYTEGGTFRFDGDSECFTIDFKKSEETDLDSGLIVNVQRVDLSEGNTIMCVVYTLSCLSYCLFFFISRKATEMGFNA